MNCLDGMIRDTLEKFKSARQASFHVAPNPVSKDKQAVSKSYFKRALMSSGSVFLASKASKKSSSGVRLLPCMSCSGVLVSSDHSLMIDDLNENNFSHYLRASEN